MTDNLALWNKLGKTDPAHTKGFTRGGGFKGTAIKPVYTEQKMTEIFGPCGVGWGINEPQFQVLNGSEGQVAVYCTVSIWIKENTEKSAPIFGVGGDFVVVKQSSGLRTNDEAMKSAFTDAVGNAMKHLGMSADVHMGRFDDSKYVSERRREEEAANGHEATREAFVASTREPPPEPALDANGKPFKHGMRIEPEMRDLWTELRNELDACLTLSQLAMLWASPKFQTEVKRLKPDWRDELAAHKDALKAKLEELTGLRSPEQRLNFRYGD